MYMFQIFQTPESIDNSYEIEKKNFRLFFERLEKDDCFEKYSIAKGNKFSKAKFKIFNNFELYYQIQKILEMAYYQRNMISK